MTADPTQPLTASRRGPEGQLPGCLAGSGFGHRLGRRALTMRTKRAKVLAVGAVAGVAAALTVGLSAPSGATATASHDRGGDQPVRLDRAFIIVLENHSEK